MIKKAALVLEGGAQQGVFAAGVLDFLMEKGIEFPYVVSASAGACGAFDFIAKQFGRTKACMISTEQEKCSAVEQLFDNRQFMNIERMFLENPNARYPFDFRAYFSSATEHEMVVTNQRTGKSEYLREKSSENRLSLIGKACGSVPVLSPPVELNGEKYYDGGVSDAIPVDRALGKGFDKIVVILTRPKGTTPDVSSKMKAFYGIALRKYRELYNAIMNRSEMYARQMKTVDELVRKGRAFVISPEVPDAVNDENRAERLNVFYWNGYNMMSNNFDKLTAFLNE